MIDSISNFNEINKEIHTILVEQSEMDSNMVRNALSLFGEELDKLFDDKIYTSINRTTDCLVLFELSQDGLNTNNLVMDDDNNIINYTSFNINIIIYGKFSLNLANKLISRLNSESVYDKLFSVGIKINNVSYPSSLNEYKNNVMWNRTDFSINISCKMQINKLENNDYIMENLSSINIIKETTQNV